MKPDNKQVPQFVLLGVLVLICIGYVSFKVIGRGATEPAAAPANESVAKNKTDGAQAVASVTQDVGAYSVFPDLAKLPTRRDPFTPQYIRGSDLEGNPANEQSRVSRVKVHPQSFQKLPRIDIKPLNPFGGMSSPNGVSRPTLSAPPETKFVLTGVVRGGSQNVAILRAGEGGRYVVRQGQTIDGRYRVILVTSDAVVLLDGTRRIYVRLGGEPNAS